MIVYLTVVTLDGIQRFNFGRFNLPDGVGTTFPIKIDGRLLTAEVWKIRYLGGPASIPIAVALEVSGSAISMPRVAS